jgi:hypothetical protein
VRSSSQPSVSGQRRQRVHRGVFAEAVDGHPASGRLTQSMAGTPAASGRR